MTAPPFAYFGGKTTAARRIVEHLPAHRAEFASGTGQGGDGWSNRVEVLWSNRAPAPTLFDHGGDR